MENERFSRLDLYLTLDHMIAALELRDFNNLNRLNLIYQHIAKNIYSNPISILDLDYSNVYQGIHVIKNHPILQE